MTTPTLYNGADTARPGPALPPGTQILAAYIGIPGQGQHSPDTPHIWAAGEWNDYLEQQPQLRFLPVYVHNYPDATPAEDADNAVNSALALGWAPNMPGDTRRIIAVDLEVMIAPAWVGEVFARIKTRGFSPMPYGSTWYVRQNPMGIGYWDAAPTNRRPSVLPPGTLGIQWRWGPQWDSNVFAQRVWDGCGQGPRRG